MRIRVPSWLRYILMVILLVSIWYAIDGQSVLERLASAHIGWVVACLASLTLQTCLNALRWRVTAKRLGHSMSILDAVRNYFLAQTINGLVPGGVAGDAVRALNAAKAVGLKQASQAVVFERLSGQIALIAITFLATLWLLLTVSNPPKPLITGLVTVFATVAIGSLSVWIAALRVAAIADWLGAAKEALLGRHVILPQVVLSMSSAMLNIFAFVFAISAVGGTLSLHYAFAVVPLVLFSMLIPITPSGWGLREGAALAVFPMVGITPEVAVAGSLLFGLLFQLSSVAGLPISTGAQIVSKAFFRRRTA